MNDTLENDPIRERLDERDHLPEGEDDTAKYAFPGSCETTAAEPPKIPRYPIRKGPIQHLGHIIVHIVQLL